jgi:uncharacterized membrane protein (UPF0127 family)
MNIVINNNSYRVKSALTNKDISNGMMNKKFDEDFDGMLFMLDGRDHSFWMKNCIIPLDIIFINEDVITKIHHNCKPCNQGKCQTYNGNGDIVLELPGGECKKYNINEGDEIIFQN